MKQMSFKGNSRLEMRADYEYKKFYQTKLGFHSKKFSQVSSTFDKSNTDAVNRDYMKTETEGFSFQD